VLKEAVALANAGYSVCILTAIYADDLYREDLKLLGNKNIEYRFYSDTRIKNIASFKERLIKRIAVFFQVKFNINSKFSLGYNPAGLKRFIKAVNAQLYIMHQELPTVVGSELVGKYNIAFDLEDWYSEDLLTEAQSKRPLALLKQAEVIALKKGVFCTTTSMALAKKLAETYSAKLPSVIYNVFPSNDSLLKKSKEFKAPLKLFWFSQTIGEGRGLEEFIKLLSSIEAGIELHLLGNVSDDYNNALKKLVPEPHKVYFYNLVSTEKLADKIAEFDIGLALELTSPPNRNYTITNKFFQYLQSGLPIIASETEGQNEAFDKFKPGFKLSQNLGDEEINSLKKWLNDPIELKSARTKAIKTAKFYNWENESKKLLILVQKAL
jgi:glycosyltransferase involved in cell wall biosynthesis